ncbi:MAG: hypothetical protein IPK25_13355 [Saprospiraceae bacterium]|nr:hypothetical protein [Saprospiraceae bacterium]
MKEVFGIVSLFVLVVLYKAYQTGELQERYTAGIGFIVFVLAFLGTCVIRICHIG